jgi:hypothetical protein
MVDFKSSFAATVCCNRLKQSEAPSTRQSGPVQTAMVVFGSFAPTVDDADPDGDVDAGELLKPWQEWME